MSLFSTFTAFAASSLLLVGFQTGAADGDTETELAEAGGPVLAETVEQTISGPEREALLSEVSRGLGEVTSARGRFHQIGADFSETQGDFYLRRPGRVRFDYDDPTPLLIVSDGTTVAVEDSDLETQDRVPLRTTPLAMLLDDTLDFETEANVLDVRKANGIVAVSLEDPSGETEGVLTVFLDASDYSIVAWRTSDPAGGVTTVSLSAVETGVELPGRLFRIEDPDADDERD